MITYASAVRGHFVPLSIFAGILALFYIVLFTGRRGRNFPGGPPTLPLIGNLHQIPRTKAYLKFTEWAKKYGGMYTLKLGPGTVVVLTDRRIIKELLDKKASSSSFRPKSEVTQGIITGNDHLLVMNNTPTWRLMRKLLHQEFVESRCDKDHIKVQEAEASQLLRDLCVSPSEFITHSRRFSNSIVMSLLFGVRTQSHDTTHMKEFYTIMDHWGKITEFGATPPVDLWPFLKLIPERFLGNWRTRAKHLKGLMEKLYGDMVEMVLLRQEKKGVQDSALDRFLSTRAKDGLSMHEYYFLGGVLMEGGSETAAGVINSFIQAITNWPEVQKKAQAEIDAVIGEDRSPQWSDYSKLPYVSTIVKEAQRWRPVAPLGIPHALSQDEWVDGKFLPKGTVIFINVWGLHHDEHKFPDPDNFDPDHYAGRNLLAAAYAVSSDYENRDHYNYGAGRRLCPGIHLADRSLFLAMSKLLWGFSFEKETDESGKQIEIDIDPITGYEDGTTVSVKPFPCHIVPRSKARQETIMKEFETAKKDVFSKFDSN